MAADGEKAQRDHYPGSFGRLAGVVGYPGALAGLCREYPTVEGTLDAVVVDNLENIFYTF